MNLRHFVNNRNAMSALKSQLRVGAIVL